MLFQILGPLLVRDGEQSIRLGGKKQQALLALLLLRPNEPVSTDTLIDGIWGGTPPESAANALQVYVSGLRKVLGPDALVTRPPGYELKIDPEQLDVVGFERAVARGRELLAASELEAAVEALTTALGLWRGRPLDGLTLGVRVEGEIARLEELRLSAIEDRLEAELGLGRHGRLVAELESRVVEQPYRERLVRLLMLALYRSGRHVEALEAYRATRRQLADRLGLEPSAGLQQLERQILAQDPALGLSAAAPGEVRRHSRRQVVVVAVELEAATPTGAVDPEAEEAALTPSVAAAAELLGRQAAHVECAGWRITAIFGLPTAREDDARRAAAAALALRARVNTAGAPVVDVLVRVGMSAGEIVSGPGGTRGRVLREAEDLARRAVPGTVLLPDRVRHLLGSAELVDVGGGLWSLDGIDVEGEAIPRRFDLPFVGRRRELGRLTAAFEAAVAGRDCRLAVVSGPPGIGKSRLAAQLADQVEDRTESVTGRCRPYGEGPTLEPLAEIVRGLAGKDIASGARKLLRGDRQAALVTERLSVGLGAADGEASQEQTFWAVRRLIEAVARRRPVLIRLEDLHWADAALLDAVDYLSERVRGAPVLLVVTARPELLEQRPGWARPDAGRTFVPLEPLGGRESDRMITALSDGGAMDDAVRSRIAGAAEGNPLFIEQMVAMAGEVGTGRDLLVPPSIQALMAARLDLLDVAEREVVERAAVIGREFSVAGLRHLLQIEPDDAAEALEVLWRKQFVDTVSSGTFRFRHQLIADAAYESIAKRARAELHERLAEGLDAAADASLETTGYHYEQAARYLEELEPGSPAAQRVGERARDRLAAAGRRALARDDVPATVSLFTRATTLPCGPDAEDLIALARSLADAGELSRSGEVLRRAEDLAASSGRPEVSAQAAVIRVELASASSERLSVEAGLATVGRAMSVLERAGTDRAVADAWYVVSSLHQLAGNTDRSAAALEQAIEWGRRGDHQRVLASAQVQLMAMAWYGPMPARQAIRRCEEVLGGASVSPRVEAAAHRALAGLRALGGSFDEARSHLDRDRSVVLDWGLRLSVAINLMQRGYVELLADDPQAAEASCREGIDLLTGTGEREHLVGLQLLFADALFLLGRLEEALQLSLVAEEGCLSDDVVEQAHWRRVRARALAARGEQVEAEGLAREAVALVGATDFLNIRGHGLLDLAHVLSYRGGFADALRALTEAEELFVRKGNLVCLERVAALRSRVLDVPVSAWA